MAYYMTGESREIDMPSNQLQCHCRVRRLLGDALLPSPLVYVSLCLLYNKRTCLIRLFLVVFAAEKCCCLTLWVVLGAYWSGNS